MSSIRFQGFAVDRFSVVKKVKDTIYHGRFSRFDDGNAPNQGMAEARNLSSDGILKLVHVELDNWYDNAKVDFTNLDNRLMQLKKTHAILSKKTFGRAQQEEGEYKRDLGLLTALVQKCDNAINHLKELSSVSDLPVTEKIARQNIIMSFKLRLKDLTRGVHDISSLDKRDSSVSSNDDLLGLEENPLAPDSSQKLWEQEQMQRETDGMGEDVDRLADSVTVLHKMFKQMHEMIFDQGTIVDRIDYNIEEGQRHIKGGVQKLVKAKEHQDNTCATKVIKCEMATALFLFLILVLKFVQK